MCTLQETEVCCLPFWFLAQFSATTRQLMRITMIRSDNYSGHNAAAACRCAVWRWPVIEHANCCRYCCCCCCWCVGRWRNLRPGVSRHRKQTLPGTWQQQQQRLKLADRNNDVVHRALTLAFHDAAENGAWRCVSSICRDCELNAMRAGLSVHADTDDGETIVWL